MKIIVTGLIMIIPSAILLSVLPIGGLPTSLYHVKYCQTGSTGQCAVTFKLKGADLVSGTVIAGPVSGNGTDFWVTDPSGSVVYSSAFAKGNGAFLFSATKPGEYILHFSDSSLSLSEKVTVDYAGNSPISC